MLSRRHVDEVLPAVIESVSVDVVTDHSSRGVHNCSMQICVSKSAVDEVDPVCVPSATRFFCFPARAVVEDPIDRVNQSNFALRELYERHEWTEHCLWSRKGTPVGMGFCSGRILCVRCLAALYLFGESGAKIA